MTIPLAYEGDLPRRMRRRQWNTPLEFARKWGVSKATAYRWIANGWIAGAVYRYGDRPGHPVIIEFDARPDPSKAPRLSHRLANPFDPYGDLPYPGKRI